MDLSLLFLGADEPNAALTLNRMALGIFFAISGYDKLFDTPRHARLTRTLQEDSVRAVPVMQWLLPCTEFSAGCALVVGLMSALAAFGLFVVCLGALAFDAGKRIAVWRPINRFDWLCDLLYLPEALYCIGLAAVMLAGLGPWSLDALIVMRPAG